MPEAGWREVARMRGATVLLVGFLIARYILPAAYPLVLALFLALAIEPLVRLLERRGLPRSGAAIFGLAAVGLTLFLGGFLCLRAMAGEALVVARRLPGLAATITGRLAGVWPQHLFGPPPAVPQRFLEQLTTGAGRAAAVLPDIALGAIVATVGAYLLARELPGLTQRAQSELPDLLPQGAARLFGIAWTAAVRYLRAQLLLALLTGSVTAVCLWLVGAPYPLLAAGFVAILDIAPALGPATVLGPWAIGAALLGHPSLAIRLALVLVATAVVRPTVEPRFVGGQVGLHPLAALASMYMGMRLFGAAGIAIGPVLAATAWAAYQGEASP